MPSTTARPAGVASRAGALLAALALGALPVAAAAADSTTGTTTGSSTGSSTGSAVTLGIKPFTPEGAKNRAAYRFRLDPGARTRDVVSIYNYAERPLALRLYPTTATLGADGSYALGAAKDSPQHGKAAGIASWINLAVPSDRLIQVAPRTRVDVPFTVRIPSGANPGDYFGGIVLGLPLKGATADSNALTVDARVGVPLSVRVGGQVRPEIEVTDRHVEYHGTRNPLEPGYVDVVYTLRNSGNVVIGGRQSFLLDASVGGERAVALNPVEKLAPGQTREVSFRVAGVWPTGKVTTHLTVTPLTVEGDPAGQQVELEDTFWAAPTAQIGVGLLLAGAAVASVLTVRRIRAPRRGATSDPASPEPHSDEFVPEEQGP